MSRAVIHLEESKTAGDKYKLFVEGDNLRQAHQGRRVEGWVEGVVLDVNKSVGNILVLKFWGANYSQKGDKWSVFNSLPVPDLKFPLVLWERGNGVRFRRHSSSSYPVIP